MNEKQKISWKEFFLPDEFLFWCYKKFTNFLYGRKIWFLATIFVVGLVSSFAWSSKVKIEVNTLYYVFSSLVQALVGLIAFMIVMVIFKFQTIDKEVEKKGNPIVKEQLTKNKKIILDFANKFIVYTFALVMINLIFLFFSQPLFSHDLGLLVLFLTAFFTGYSFYLVIRITSNLLF